MPTAFEVIAEPNRRRVLDVLRAGARPVGEIAEALAIRQPTASKHLRVLREAGLVEVHTSAQLRIYSVRPGPLREIDAWLEPYRQMWESRLDALERHLDAIDPAETQE